MTTFTPWAGLAGGVLIGLGAAVYLLALGRIAGISGMLEQALRPSQPGFILALTFLIAIPVGALAAVMFGGGQVDPRVGLQGGSVLLISAGLLVGFGTRLANGCTSGHGVCGLPRFSIRSIAATATFMGAAMATVFVARHVL